MNFKFIFKFKMGCDGYETELAEIIYKKDNEYFNKEVEIFHNKIYELWSYNNVFNNEYDDKIIIYEKGNWVNKEYKLEYSFLEKEVPNDCEIYTIILINTYKYRQ